MTQFSVGDKVRTIPKPDGSFKVGTVQNFLLDIVEIDAAGVSTYHSPTQLELYEYTHNVGTIRIGDRVRLFGMEGEFTLVGFYESSTTGEMKAKVKGTEGAFPFAANYVRKA